jgi:hypothetical protein
MAFLAAFRDTQDLGHTGMGLRQDTSKDSPAVPVLATLGLPTRWPVLGLEAPEPAELAAEDRKHRAEEESVDTGVGRAVAGIGTVQILPVVGIGAEVDAEAVAAAGAVVAAGVVASDVVVGMAAGLPEPQQANSTGANPTPTQSTLPTSFY